MFKKILGLLTVFSWIGTASAATPLNDADPYENYNRHAYRMNHQLDQMIFKPLARVYKAILPRPIFTGFTHFFSNLGEIPTVANDLLQAKFYQATSDTWRFTINSTLGVLGLFDVASTMGLPKHHEDFGLTLAQWGVKSSPYIVLPILGPSSLRDMVAILPNYMLFSPYNYLYPVDVRNSLQGVNVVNDRANYLSFDKTVQQASLDPYVFEKNIYLQRRAYQIAASATDDSQKNTSISPITPTSHY